MDSKSNISRGKFDTRSQNLCEYFLILQVHFQKFILMRSLESSEAYFCITRIIIIILHFNREKLLNVLKVETS